MTGFKNFLLRGNLIDLAVAFVVGAAFATVVAAFTAWFTSLMPDSLDDVFSDRTYFGAFMNAVIAFVIVSATGVVRSPWLVTTNRVVAILGIVVFLLGISYPMAHARVQSVLANRRRRRLDTDLLPLWRLVTDAVPEVVLPDPGQLSPTTRLHRRVVETRDALTQVSPYLPVAFDYAEVGVQARMLRAAVAAMTSTEAGDKTSGAVRDLAPADGEGLEADAAPLIRLSTALLVPEDTDVSPGSHAEAAG